MKRTGLILALALLLAPTLFSQDNGGDEKIKLTVVNWAGIHEVPLTQQIVDEFMRRHPHIEVVFQPTPDAQYENKILTGLAAGEPPDVFLLDSKSIPSFNNKKVLLDLNPYVDSLGVDTTQWFSRVTDIAREDDALYSFPKGFTPLMVYYNKKLFDKEGVPYPTNDWTRDDYLRISRRLTKDLDGDGETDQYGTNFTNYFFNWIPWVWSAGGDVIGPDEKKASGYLNTETNRKTFQYLIDLRKKYDVAPDVGSWSQSGKTGIVRALFLNNKMAMIVDGHWRIPGMLDYMESGVLDLGVVGFPRGPDSGKVNVMYESGYCVPVIAPHKKEAVMLAAFMTGEYASRVRSQSRLELSAHIEVAHEMARTDKYGWEQKFLDEVEYCRQPWGSRIERFTEIEMILQDMIDEVILNDKPLDDMLDEYAVKVDDKLEHIRENASFEFKQIEQHTEVVEFLLGVTVVVAILLFILYRRAKGRDRAKTRFGFVFLAPSMIHLIFFLITPMVFSLYLSFHRWDIVVPDKPFVGFDNYIEMFNDPTFWNSIGNTFLYLLNVPVTMTISLAVALMMHKRLGGIGFLRTLYFLPSVTSFVAISLVWMWIYNPQYGLANYMLTVFGFPKLDWLNSTDTAMMSVIIFTVWLQIGYQMVIFLAGLQGIPDELYEVARIDGASPWKQFWRVTLPLLKPTTFFILVTSVISSFQIFTTIYVMTQGGPVGATDVFVYHIYDAAWNQLRMGYASAMAWFLFFIVLVFTGIQFKLVGKNVDYS
ncbi:MAG: extracellular solute-binding protein [Ignavibacteriales bacterium]|nr:extracellular solute-binding protein [Ignavibacteriales bacterium]